MKKLISMVLVACIVLTYATFACAADTSEHTPPFKVLHGTYSYDPAAAAAAEAIEPEDEPTNTSDTSDTVEPPFKVIHGTFSYDPPKDGANEIITRATTKPTTLAPTSFYNVKHYWTATNYTWSSYIFTQALGYRFDSRAKQNFAVEFYRQNGVYEGTATADYNSLIGGYWVQVDWEYNPSPYYVKIVNKSGSPIRSNAFYYVSDLSHSLPLGPIS